ncbi:Isopentenyl phosphate kinase, enzyme of modifiedmevalonate pathway [Halanaeroarchaeum sp. HSR-CO]|uniref:isopentenyl phosphate kinase n=1 Tax=Halanaeroarchaeum sp. HSR-CO TaxID=2866382 RepID=UPI00217F0EBE|nr:isopentenyl phosphate kinase [Halanaeroarchaeum sp. HSR-CO]UWG48268.1 Isopentenyl phosphate kinase, enzyme of modifiedmevalonate pathway [Halanaeroarchaeum sp. HSR-CO]
MTTILKLGGSVVTKKDNRETVDDEALSRATSAIADAGVDDLVVVHGGGSFGHPNAADRDVSSDSGTHDTASIRAIHRAMGRLVRRVTDDLGAAAVPAVPVRPFSAGYRTGEGDVELYTDSVETMLEEGFVPVLHGDVFPTEKRGATIVSGDELVVALAKDLDAERVGLCSTVPGVLDDDGDVVPRIEQYSDVAAVLGGSDSTDVTGGMAAKVRALLDAEVPASIFGLGDLEEFLAGGGAGTLVGPAP